MTDDTRPNPLPAALFEAMDEAITVSAGRSLAELPALHPGPAFQQRRLDIYREEFAKRGLVVALAASGAVTEGLDVERLARAIREDDDHSLGGVDAYRPEAIRIAAEYARLSGVTDR